jgi:hypothetical protein
MEEIGLVGLDSFSLKHASTFYARFRLSGLLAKEPQPKYCESFFSYVLQLSRLTKTCCLGKGVRGVQDVVYFFPRGE